MTLDEAILIFKNEANAWYIDSEFKLCCSRIVSISDVGATMYDLSCNKKVFVKYKHLGKTKKEVLELRYGVTIIEDEEDLIRHSNNNWEDFLKGSSERPWFISEKDKRNIIHLISLANEKVSSLCSIESGIDNLNKLKNELKVMCHAIGRFTPMTMFQQLSAIHQHIIDSVVKKPSVMVGQTWDVLGDPHVITNVSGLKAVSLKTGAILSVDDEVFTKNAFIKGEKS